MRIVGYVIFCILVFVASVLIRRPSSSPDKEQNFVEKQETAAQTSKAQKSLPLSRIRGDDEDYGEEDDEDYGEEDDEDYEDEDDEDDEDYEE